MDVIGNNIANVNTTGFKSGRVTFQDTLSQTSSAASAPSSLVGGTNPKQIGLGVGVAGIDTIFTDGAIQSTGKNTDLCMSGEGLFVVKSGSETYYTRNGAFAFDYNGDYVLPGSGMYVQGWVSDETGTLDMTADISKINVKAGKRMAAKATSTIDFYNNLNADPYMIKSVYGGKTVQRTTKNFSDASDGTASVNSATEALTLTMADGSTAGYKEGETSELTEGSTYSVGGTYTATYTANTAVKSKTRADTNTLRITTTSGATLNNMANDSYTIGENLYVLTLADGTKAGTKTAVAVGDDYSATYTGTGDSVKKNTNNSITITLSDDSTVADTDLINGTTYAIGAAYGTTGLTIKSIAYTSTVTATATEKISSIEYSSEIKSMVAVTKACCIGTEDNPVYVVYNDGTSDKTATYKTGSYRVGESLPQASVMTVYDALGGAHSLPIYFTKTGSDSNTSTWRVSLQVGDMALDSSGEADAVTESTVVLETDFSGNPKVTASMNPITLHFNGKGELDTNYTTNRTATFTLTNGAEDPQEVTVDFSNLTQSNTGFGSDNTIRADVNGYAAGTLKSVEVNNLGQLIGVYTNSERLIEGQVALAQFTNAAGLTKTGSSLYQESNNSGQAIIGTASGFGVSITSSALEMSNVDIANEFSDMIVTQRGFQTNSKIITVSDEMLETLVNMKR